MSVSEIMDFSANINDFLPIPDLSEIYSAVNVMNYPDTDLRRYSMILSDYIQAPVERIMLGPGLTYFIYRIAELFSGARVLIFEPSFTEYRRAFLANNCDVVMASIGEMQARIGDIEKGNYDFIVITRPDNPLGNAIGRNALLGLAASAAKSGTKVFVDEAFADFLGLDELRFSSRLPDKFDNIILGRSLTKILAIPSLRLGYIVSCRPFIDGLKARLEPWAVSQPALTYLDRVDFQKIAGSVEQVGRERDYLIRMIEKKGFVLQGNPVANFATFLLPGSVEPTDLDEFLQSRNILVRFLGDHSWLGSNYIRIAVKERSKTDRLLYCLDEFLSTLKSSCD